MISRGSRKEKDKSKQESNQTFFKLNGAQNIGPKDCQQAISFIPFGYTEYKIQKNNEIQQTQVQTIEDQNYEGLLGQIIIESKNDRIVGTGTLLFSNNDQDKENPRVFILTAAHNLFQFRSEKSDLQDEDVINEEETEFQKKYRIAEALRFFYQRNGENYFCFLDGRYFHLYPNYQTSPKIGVGNDIALIEAINYRGLYCDSAAYNIAYRWDRTIEDINPRKGEKICLIGYPQNKRGQLFKIEGTIKQINITAQEQITIFYDDIEPVSGQNGAPVFLYRNSCWYLIGVNVGFDAFEKAFVATGINNKVLDWIKEKQRTCKLEDIKKSDVNLQQIVDISIQYIQLNKNYQKIRRMQVGIISSNQRKYLLSNHTFSVSNYSKKLLIQALNLKALKFFRISALQKIQFAQMLTQSIKLINMNLGIQKLKTLINLESLQT